MPEADSSVPDSASRLHGIGSLHTVETLFQLFITATSDSIYRMSPDWREMYALDGKNVLASTTTPTASWLDFYIPEDEKTLVQAAISEAIQTKSTFELEHRVILTDGTVGWTLSRAIPVLDTQGKLAEWFGAASHITERKRAEATVRELNWSLERQLEERIGDLRQAEQALRTATEQIRMLGSHQS